MISSFRAETNWRHLPQCKMLSPWSRFGKNFNFGSTSSPSTLVPEKSQNFRSSDERKCNCKIFRRWILPKTWCPHLLHWSAQDQYLLWNFGFLFLWHSLEFLIKLDKTYWHHWSATTVQWPNTILSLFHIKISDFVSLIDQNQVNIYQGNISTGIWTSESWW